ncbi:hypothetical protein EWM64_g5109 [Hericium alpestre]|uniref:Uncharacterized protein n=1 Tax=Hericium alpestre TaxID=135208 RepID=A0A4Y9ZXH7_9AGAM|nr:hypothetical protein EWM64_g5109 [Hericium alpestre]
MSLVARSAAPLNLALTTCSGPLSQSGCHLLGPSMSSHPIPVPESLLLEVLRTFRNVRQFAPSRKRRDGAYCPRADGVDGAGADGAKVDGGSGGGGATATIPLIGTLRAAEEEYRAGRRTWILRLSSTRMLGLTSRCWVHGEPLELGLEGADETEHAATDELNFSPPRQWAEDVRADWEAQRLGVVGKGRTGSLDEFRSVVQQCFSAVRSQVGMSFATMISFMRLVVTAENLQKEHSLPDKMALWKRFLKLRKAEEPAVSYNLFCEWHEKGSKYAALASGAPLSPHSRTLFIHDNVRIENIDGSFMAFMGASMPSHLRECLYSELKACVGDLLHDRNSEAAGEHLKFGTFHFSWYNRLVTKGHTAPTDIQPLYLSREGTSRTNYTQMTPYGATDKELFALIELKLYECLPRKYQILSMSASSLPCNSRSVVRPFVGYVVNINVATKAHRDDKDDWRCLVLPIGDFEGGALVFYEPGLVIDAREGKPRVPKHKVKPRPVKKTKNQAVEEAEKELEISILASKMTQAEVDKDADAKEDAQDEDGGDDNMDDEDGLRTGGHGLDKEEAELNEGLEVVSESEDTDDKDDDGSNDEDKEDSVEVIELEGRSEEEEEDARKKRKDKGRKEQGSKDKLAYCIEVFRTLDTIHKSLPRAITSYLPAYLGAGLGHFRLLVYGYYLSPHSIRASSHRLKT